MALISRPPLREVFKLLHARLVKHSQITLYCPGLFRPGHFSKSASGKARIIKTATRKGGGLLIYENGISVRFSFSSSRRPSPMA